MSKKGVSFHIAGLFCIVLLMTGGMFFLSGCGPSAQPRWDNSENSGYANSSNAHQGARLTVVLAVYSQANQVDRARIIKQRAVGLLGGNDVWLARGPLGLAVNYGHFSSNSKAQKALKRVRKEYKNLHAGRYQFCYVKEIPSPDPPAPAQWNLLNSNCYFTLEIGTYFDEPDKDYYDRKKDALRGVRSLREQGEVAFLVHGQHESRVYVGCFGPDEIIENRRKNKIRVTVSPAIKRLQKIHPYRLEQGGIIYNIKRDVSGRKIRQARPSIIRQVTKIREELLFK